jgi:hypothetical protein
MLRCYAVAEFAHSCIPTPVVLFGRTHSRRLRRREQRFAVLRKSTAMRTAYVNGRGPRKEVEPAVLPLQF